jgi:uncharacterized SAM-binding protein YcdF (DUF218 family)
MKHALRVLGMLAGGGLVAGLIGFAWFVHIAARSPPLPAQADGIVALTGGADRVETALHLLADGRARKLLLSGIGGNAELATLAHRAGIDPVPIAADVTLGRNATTTRGNADETALWAQENAIRSLIVVTAGYHMPRALAEIARAIPDVTLYPLPVTPHALRDTGAAGRAMRLRLMAEEYVKFLAASLDLTALAPAHHGRLESPREDRLREDGAHEDSAGTSGTRRG